MKLCTFGILLILCNALLAQTPDVQNVRFEQRTDGALLVDIYYDATDPNGNMLEIIVEASDNNGETWTLPCTSLTGDVGKGIAPGTDKHMVWDFYADNPDTSGYGYRVRVTAHDMGCRLFVTADTTLVEDMEIHPGTPFAIWIGAPNVTLDLGGHVVSGYVRGDFAGGVTAENVEGITIRNGTLEGFLGAISLINTDNATIENLTIRNLDVSDIDTFVVGIGVGESQEVVIRNIMLKFLPAMHKEAIILGISDADVSNIEIHGGSVGVNLGGACDLMHNGNNVTIHDSKFFGQTGMGILIQCTNGVRIADNEFSENLLAIMGEPAFFGGTDGIVIEGNYIHDGGSGIELAGVSKAKILNNVITDNGPWGIRLVSSLYCYEPFNECSCSTENLIFNNVVTGHYMADLYHHEDCVGNTWERNIYETKQGAEIPACDVCRTTARGVLTSVDSTAAGVAADAQLLFVSSSSCDTTGKSNKWIYIYESANQQSNYEFWFKNGQIIEQDSVTIPWAIIENNLPIQESWIDSDSAITMAEENGGFEFRKTYINPFIEIDLENELVNNVETRPVWHIRYISHASGEIFIYDVFAGENTP